MSVYNSSNTKTATTREGHVTSMFLVFDAEVLLLILTACALLTGLMAARFAFNVRLSVARKRATEALVGTFLKKHDSFSSKIPSGFSINALYMILTITAFYVVYFMTSMIKTDMVVVDPPVTVTSFADILSSHRRPVWLRVMTDHESFAQAKEGSVMASVWTRAEELGISESFVESSISAVVRHATACAEQREVFITHQLLAEEVLLWNMCAASRAMNLAAWVNILFRSDPVARETQRVFAHNAFLDKQVARYVTQRTQQLFEGHTMPAAMRRVDVTPLLHLEGNERRFRDIHLCSCNLLPRSHPDWRPATPAYEASSLVLLIAGLMIASVCLSYEVMKKARQSVKRRRLTRVAPRLQHAQRSP